MAKTANITEKKIIASPMYVLGIPATLSEKQNPVSHLDENLQEIIGHTNSVIVVPQSNRLTIACDCCIRQYCLITHIRKNDSFS